MSERPRSEPTPSLLPVSQLTPRLIVWLWPGGLGHGKLPAEGLECKALLS
jgi:hypothetical protein